MNISLAQKHHDLNIACAQQLADILKEVDLHEQAERLIGTAAGDKRKLRGVPIQAEGVGGTSPGSDPVTELLEKERRRSLR